MKLCFLHPNLGLGGAEQLIAQLAHGLSKTHQVVIYTNYFDKNRCFPECLELKVVSKFDWIPSHINNHFYIFFAWLKFILLSLYVFWHETCDAFIVDQISISIPLLQLKSPVLFYCHFPDQLLTQRNSFLKKLYRWPFDFLERVTTNAAANVFVNSEFTKAIYHDTFGDKQVHVLYPGTEQIKYTGPPLWDNKLTVITSINRFEGKKSLQRAIKAFNTVKQQIERPIFLLMAGGYDPSLKENKDTLESLQLLCQEYKLAYQELDGKTINTIDFSAPVVFLKSFTNEQKQWILSKSKCVLYTPSNEHFGIVPIESMAYGCPVIGMKSGGVMETIVHGQCGYLCREAFDVQDMSNYLLELLTNKQLWMDISRFNLQRKKFTIKQMIATMNEHLDTISK